jgi:hypothetical protein
VTDDNCLPFAAARARTCSAAPAAAHPRTASTTHPSTMLLLMPPPSTPSETPGSAAATTTPDRTCQQRTPCTACPRCATGAPPWRPTSPPPSLSPCLRQCAEIRPLRGRITPLPVSPSLLSLCERCVRFRVLGPAPVPYRRAYRHPHFSPKSQLPSNPPGSDSLAGKLRH